MTRKHASNKTVTNFVFSSMNGTRKAVCFNNFTLCGILPEGTQKALQTTSSGCFFCVMHPVGELSEKAPFSFKIRLEPPDLQWLATIWNKNGLSYIHREDMQK